MHTRRQKELFGQEIQFEIRRNENNKHKSRANPNMAICTFTIEADEIVMALIYSIQIVSGESKDQHQNKSFLVKMVL